MSSTPQRQLNQDPNNHIPAMNTSPSMQNIPPQVSSNTQQQLSQQQQQPAYGGYQPRFIKKKPQNIASIDSSKELPVNMSNGGGFVDQGYDQHPSTESKSSSNLAQGQNTNIFYAPLQKDQLATSEKIQEPVLDEEEKMINEMMEDLKKQKIQQQQQLQFQLIQNQAVNNAQQIDQDKKQKNVKNDFSKPKIMSNKNNNLYNKTQQQKSNEQQQNQLQIETFQIQNSYQVYQDSSGYVSLQQRSDILNITQSPPKKHNFNDNQNIKYTPQNLNSNQNNNKTHPQQIQIQTKENHQNQEQSQTQDYDEIKRKKLDELKRVVMQETNQQFNTIQATSNIQRSKSPSLLMRTPNNQKQGGGENMKRNAQESMKNQKQQYQTSPIKSQQHQLNVIQGQRTSDRTPTRELSRTPNDKNIQRTFPKYNPILDGKSTQLSRQQQQSRLNHFETVQPNTQRNDNIDIFKTKSQQSINTNLKRDLSSNQKQMITKSSSNQNSQLKMKTTQSQSKINKELQKQQSIIPNKQTNQKINQTSKDPMQLSEKTQQIYFKKLQKEVEVAIRDADNDEKGGIDIEEFKQCLFNLTYLPYLNPQNQQYLQNPENSLNRANDHTFQTTLRGLIIQEKEFVYNMWQVLNPLNNQSIDNAMLYDVLLLLIYNVKSTIPTTAAFLQEYLENHYHEEGVQLEQVMYNNGGVQNLNDRSLNMGSFDIPRDQEDNSSLLSRYLAFNNLWSVEKIAMEFKQIHANKVSYTQALRMRSPSPLSQNKQIQLVLLDPNINNKKFKPQVLNDHLSELTFSPNLSNQTKKLDQQLTSRLIQETQHFQGIKRDVSADNITRNQPPLSHNFSSANNLLPQNTQNMQNQFTNQNQNSTQQPINRYELLFYRHHLAEQKIEKAKENLINKELEECSFQPNASRMVGLNGHSTSVIGMAQQNTQNMNNLHSKTYQNLRREANQIFQDLSQKIKNQKLKYEEKNSKEEKELEECTFKPNILNNNHKKAQKPPAADKLPKGYQEQINRIRKIAEEKKAQEDKQKKKETGENYEKLKQLPIKPPSFVDKQREKRKLIMYVDVNITPTKAGRIGIYEGDSIKDLAKNFQRTFQLNNSMLVLLQQQLEQHLMNYKEKHGIYDENKTIFPKIDNKDLTQANIRSDSAQGVSNFQEMQEKIDLDQELQYAAGFGDSEEKSRNYYQNNIMQDSNNPQTEMILSAPTFDHKRNRANQIQNTFSIDNVNLDHHDEDEGVNVNLDELDGHYYLKNQQDKVLHIRDQNYSPNDIDDQIDQNYYLNEDQQQDQDRTHDNKGLQDLDENERLNEYVRQEIERYDRLARESQQMTLNRNFNDRDINQAHFQYKLPEFGVNFQQQQVYENINEDSFSQ